MTLSLSLHHRNSTHKTYTQLQRGCAFRRSIYLRQSSYQFRTRHPLVMWSALEKVLRCVTDRPRKAPAMQSHHYQKKKSTLRSRNKLLLFYILSPKKLKKKGGGVYARVYQTRFTIDFLFFFKKKQKGTARERCGTATEEQKRAFTMGA